MNEIKERFYRNSMLAVLGVTRALQRADYNLPTKWFSFVEGLRASSGIIHDRVADLDENVSKEFIEKEEMIDRRLGKKKFYDEEEVEELQDKINQIQL